MADYPAPLDQFLTLGDPGWGSKEPRKNNLSNYLRGRMA